MRLPFITKIIHRLWLENEALWLGIFLMLILALGYWVEQL